MNTREIEERLVKYVREAPGNLISEDYALTPDIVGMPLFRDPIVRCASADDPWFQKIHDDETIVGPDFVMPHDWLPDAKSVISICYPFSKEVCDSNLDNLDLPSDPWLHGRVEGHDFIHDTDKRIVAWLESLGCKAVIPALDPTLRVNKRDPEDAVGRPMFASSWSERHVAFTAGIGTFGLCTHLITEVGKAHRLGSIITNAPIEVTARAYGDDPFAYCNRCGACTKRCPVDALTLEGGKDYQTCWVYMEETKIRFKPRYGCGKCQLMVPCAYGIPKKN